MKKIKAALVSAIMLCAALVAGVQSASAGSPLRFGVKAGVNVNEMKFNESHSTPPTARASPAV